MAYKSKLYQLVEASDPKERMNARIRKRRQRAKEQVIRQTNPFDMVLVVKNRMNGDILIIDKESYTPKYHEIIVAPERINQSILNDILQDPKFTQTETSKRLFGNVKTDEAPADSTGPADSNLRAVPGTNGEQQIQQVTTPVPRQDIPFSMNNLLSGPVIGLGMMAGLSSQDLLKLGITEDELNEFNSSEEIQRISMKLAKDIAYYFKNSVGRDIREYTPTIIKNQLFNTTDYWKKMGGFDSMPKTDIVFRHKCVEESGKNNKCQETNCACTEAGVVQSEQMITFTVKYGASPVLSGKMNNESHAILYSTISLIDSMLNGNPIPDIQSQFDEKEKDGLKKLEDDIKFIKNICKTYISEKLETNSYNPDPKKQLELIDKLAQEIHLKIERIINSNILYRELFLHEALTGYLKFGSGSPANANKIIGILPDQYSVAMDDINIPFTRKIFTEDTKFVVSMKSVIDQSPDEKVEMESCKIRFGGRCPKLFTPDKFLIRNLINGYIGESKHFSYSPLRYLIEKKNQPITLQDFSQAIQNATGLIDLMNIFAIKPSEITISPIDFFTVSSTTFSAEKNIIRINGKIFQIPVQTDPIQVSDQETITEEINYDMLMERLINLKVKPKSAKRRDYRGEYKKFQASKKSKQARANRNRNRRIAMKKKLVRRGDKIDLDHIDGNPMHNYTWNLHRLPRSKNRAKH